MGILSVADKKCCHKKKVQNKNPSERKKFPVVGRTFLLQGNISCSRGILSVAGKNSCHRKKLPVAGPVLATADHSNYDVKETRNSTYL